MSLEGILVIDESGAKGYAGKKPKPADEFGVVSGYMIPVDSYDRLLGYIEELAFPESNAKAHITDRDPADQHRIREDLFQILAESLLSKTAAKAAVGRSFLWLRRAA